MRQLPPPRPGTSALAGLTKFKKLIGVDDTQWLSVLAFLLGGFRPGGPYFLLAVEGEQGSGKSLRCEMIKRVIDPTMPSRSTLPDKTQDLMIIASHQYLIVFDNLSGVRNEMSDALAALSTGSGFQTRKLYTNDQLATFSFARPFALNGIGEYVHRPDLMDRAIPLRLEPMADGARRTEAEIWREFDALLPELLHDIYTAVAHALATVDETPIPTSIRMADAAHWLAAAEEAVGLNPGTFLKAIEEAQQTTQADLAMQDSLFPELERVLFEKAFDGRPADLLDKLLNLDVGRRDRFFPRTAAQLSTKLRRLRPALATAGILVEFPERTREGRHIRAWLTEEAKKAAEPRLADPGAFNPKY